MMKVTLQCTVIVSVIWGYLSKWAFRLVKINIQCGVAMFWSRYMTYCLQHVHHWDQSSLHPVLSLGMDAVCTQSDCYDPIVFDSYVKASVWASAGLLPPAGSVFKLNKCPSYAVLCRTHLLAVLNVTGLDSGPTMLTALLVQQLYGSLITTLETAATQARVYPGLMCSQIL